MVATPLSDIVFTVVDCETTGLHVEAGDRLVAIGAVRVDGVWCARTTFDALINPGGGSPNSTSFHGITDEMVADAAGPSTLSASSPHTQLTRCSSHIMRVSTSASCTRWRSPQVCRWNPLTIDTMLLSAVLEPDPEARHGLDYV